MVEEVVTYSKPKSKSARPRPVYLWTVSEVQKWLRRHCSDYYPLYADNFLQRDDRPLALQHEITGRTLIRFSDTTLARLGVEDPRHRQEIWREITKLRLKTDIIEIRDLQRRNNNEP
ncbi:protein aveugle isoform X1 [Bacillus rossius redtenbacheri]|uniref:protein aveugle isoform X1 n=1 Tax=Bacillus rossius redtenbacheri TaxID=93214 RepID=UPI002FDEE0DB